ncbi:LuxR C-terminal-related transcriptional regulator [Streptomyces sp. NPDC058653]|uniref:helix-turn-helix transcriptional regulator n=1 Tax=Streptomyces sp. NPDC058653 TaxID=3346576 RepID=UPI00364E0A69
MTLLRQSSPASLPSAGTTSPTDRAHAAPGHCLRATLLRHLGPDERWWAEALTALSDATLRELAGQPTDAGQPLPDPGLPRVLAALTPDQSTAGGYGAVLGPDISPTLLATVSGWEVPRTLAVLDELVARRVLREDKSGAPLFHFRHPLLRALAYTRIPPGRRIAAHAAAADALGRVGAPLTRQAPHLARSAPPGNADAADRLHRAAAQLLDTRPDTAADWLRAALRVHPKAESGAAVGALLRIRGQLCVAAARSGERDDFVRQLPLVLASPALTTEERTRLIELHARLEDGLGGHREARALLDAALSGPICPESAPLVSRSAALHAASGEVAIVRKELAVVARITDAPDPARGMGGAASLALATVLASDTTARDAAVDEAAHRAGLLTDAMLTDALDAIVRLGRAQHLTGRHADAARLFARGVRCARLGGRTVDLPALLIGQAAAETTLGRLGVASTAAVEAEAVARSLGCAELAHQARVVRGWIALWSVGHEAASALIPDLAQPGELPDGPGRAATLLMAAVQLEAGRPDDSLRLLLSGAADAGAPPDPATGPAVWWSLASRAAAAGRSAGARTWVATARAAAARSRLAADHAAVLRAEAALATDEAAIPLLAAAVKHHANDGALLLECRTRLLLARRLMEAGRLTEATLHAGLAKSRAEHTDSGHLRQLSVDVQRAIGARRPRGARGPDVAGAGLSHRERQILGMVCRGMSNRDIARDLFVSVKTVEAHLTRVFRKTGTRSRAALVAAYGTARPAGV